MTGFAHDHIVPDPNAGRDKKAQVAGMFDDIARRYDFMNRFLSAGIDIGWRKKALRKLSASAPRELLDVATGTAELAILAARMLKPQQILGIDISEGMLEVGRKKIAAAGLSPIIQLRTGDSERIEAEDTSFDAVTVSFGVRNFADLTRGLTEIHRVLRPDGTILILEFSKPTTWGLRHLYRWYMNVLAPFFGGLFTRNPAAYRYLHASVQHFPEGNAFLEVLQSAGFRQMTCEKLSFGICSIYSAIK
ncbi:MAG: bifunctional demethylmenaquinone methyltransferase/2-methoxy-6-polyprenyl-1,4-benzoquinol methylase UbiE [Bacteroidetes bacterium]|nr:bifunctional demethylmenaquinone methyltransferase/2-methoxy-6-polyprenyl-1,4-benzoquinol methylase UbiE [Bacteroidota bacterium]